MHNQTFEKASFALAALFVLGDGIVVLPSESGNRYTILSFLAVAFFGIALYFFLCFVYSKFSSYEKNSRVINIAEIFVLPVVAVFSLFVSSKTFSVFIWFVSKVVLKNVPLFIITVVFGGAVLYFAFKRQEIVLKFSLMSFVVVLFFITVFFLLSFSDYRLKNLSIEKSFSWEDFTQSARTFLNPIFSCFLLPFYYRFALKKSCFTAHLGVITGFLLLGVCILSSVLLFGTELSANLSFPHFSAVSTITVGRLYTRLDGFLYFIYFVTTIIKIRVCTFVCYSSLKRLRKIQIF